MAQTKQKLVIKPKSVHVAQAFDIAFPVSEQSVFSDSYDWETERKRLSGLSDEESGHSDAAALEVLAAHEMLLKQHIMRQRIRSGRARSRSIAAVDLDDYEIYPSEDRAFEDVGQLGGSEDAFELHTKHAVRMWEGRNDPKGPRWPGIRYAMGLCGELARSTKADNPFAHAELLRLESEMEAVSAQLATDTDRLQQQLEACGSGGIHISVVANNNPLLIKVASLRGYGFRLLQLLLAYDYLVRVAMTMGMKGVMTNHASNDVIHKSGRGMRVLLQGIYLSAMRIRQIRQVNRRALLENDALAAKLAEGVAAGGLSPLLKEVLLYETKPAYVYVVQKIEADRLNELYEKALALGLIEYSDTE